MEGLLSQVDGGGNLGESRGCGPFQYRQDSRCGCYITSGKLQRNCKVRVHRRQKQVRLRSDLDFLASPTRTDVKKRCTGFECGIGCGSFRQLQDKDRVGGLQAVTSARTLSTN